jgi:hypothetical protein
MLLYTKWVVLKDSKLGSAKMRVLARKNTKFFSLLAVFIITVVPKVGVYINTNNYNTIRYDLGFPATWLFSNTTV